MATHPTPPKRIEIRGAKVHNLKNLDVDIPLHQVVGIAGVSGSGKSSLALGVVYAEGSRRYLEALSTYTRRRMTQAAQAEVESVRYVPAALALHQRPGVPGIRSTFGTGTELLNALRLMYSRLASHRCPNGHYLAPTLAVAAGQPLTCPTCGAAFYAPGAEELAFNSQGACRTCGGTGVVRTVDLATLVPDDTLSIDQGAVAPWKSLMWALMTDVCRAMGVRTDVPFRDLTDREKDIVYHGPAEKKHILYHAKNSNDVAELDFTYYNAVHTVENALAKVKDEKGMKRVEKFLKEEVCPACGGTRLSEAARAPRLRGIGLDEACQLPLSDLVSWVAGVPETLPEAMGPMAQSIVQAFQTVAQRLMELGLGYLTLDRGAATLSTGEVYPVQRVLYYDPDADIAVIQISKTSRSGHVTSAFAHLDIAPSGTRDVRPGDPVYTLSDPLGMGLAVSSGIISATNRDVERYSVPCLMSTADISQGSSGGALLNALGQVIGVTSGAYTYGNSMYLAVPIDPVLSADLTGEGWTIREIKEREAA